MDSSRRTRVLAAHLVPCGVAAPGAVLLSETENVRAEKVGRVVILTMVRTKSLNALCDPLMADLAAALAKADADVDTGCVVLTGSEKAFAAGADIKEMAPLSFSDIVMSDKFKAWQCVAETKIPVIAAVNGFAFGGGCEVAMMSDIIIASEKALFGQPEIKLGIIPGAGGTQRLIRSIGKSKAMALILSGRNITAAEAEKAGLVYQVVPHDKLLPEAMKLAEEIAGMGRLATALAKEAVNSANESTLQAGVGIEKKLFNSLFSTEDKREGMDAFINKRKPSFKHR